MYLYLLGVSNSLAGTMDHLLDADNSEEEEEIDSFEGFTQGGHRG